MPSREKGVFSTTSLFLVDHIAQAEMGKIKCQGMLGKRDVEEGVAEILLIQARGEVEEKKVARGIGSEFRPDWLNRRAISKSIQCCFGSSKIEGATEVIHNFFFFVEKGFCGETVVA